MGEDEGMEYDKRTCITAQELRSSGIAVPDEVPDCGWIRRGAWRIEQKGVQADGRGGVSADFIVTFTDAFRWVDATLVTQIGVRP